MTKKVLAVVAHSDDEALGCGGTLARHVDEGDHVSVVFVADGVSSRLSVSPGDARRRHRAAVEAQAILGLHEVHHLDLPDNRLDSLPLLDVVQAIERIVTLIAPEVVYTHHHGDLNIDHRVVHEAVMTTCRPMPGSSVREIYSFEVMSSTEWSAPDKRPFLPQLRVDIGDQLQRKIDALGAYAEEMRGTPHSRSIEHLRALAFHRGNEVGVEAAEAFMILRMVR